MRHNFTLFYTLLLISLEDVTKNTTLIKSLPSANCLLKNKSCPDTKHTKHPTMQIKLIAKSMIYKNRSIFIAKNLYNAPMLANLHHKKIIFGITGGIAAYKACELIRLLKANQAQVKVIPTPAALEFITPLTLRTLSGNQVYANMFEQHLTLNIEHIELARWADLILIAPASANTIAKLAHGIADNLLTTVCLATKAPIALAPAMNYVMWENPITHENITILTAKNLKIFGPGKGVQACDENGYGRMLEPTELLELTHQAFAPPLLKNKKIVITAGPTFEPIDPVRYLGNHSSGKMGYALAEAAADFGATVKLISGPTNLPIPRHVTCAHVTNAKEMLTAAMSEIKDCAIFIAAAAVADYRPIQIAAQKIKQVNEKITLQLTKNPDILANVAALPHPPFTVGFAAETENLVKNATQKLKHKKIDLMIANRVGANLGFNQEQNAVTVITKNGEKTELTLKNKLLLAHELLAIIADLSKNHRL